jgi:hypothetical protein
LLLGGGSPVLSLDETIDAVLHTGSEVLECVGNGTGSGSGACADAGARLACLEGHVRRLHWEEQVRHLRVAQRALTALEIDIDEPVSTSVLGANNNNMATLAPLALRFLAEQEQSACGGSGGFESTRAALLALQSEETADDDTAELHAALQDVTAKLLAKSRAQRGAFRLVA